MDAAGLLKKQGWRGTGHSLDSSNKGLRKPLLISKKIDVLGVGINKHDVIAGQWWMKAFDSSLKDFGTGKKSILSTVKDHGIKRGGLYGRFVKGEGVPGTIGVVDPRVAAIAVTGGTKRKAEDSEDEQEAKRAKKDKKDKKRAKTTSSSSSSSDDDKKQRRAAKKAAKANKSTPTSEDPSDATTRRGKSKKEKSLDGLPEDKRKQYEERAAAKGLSLQEYFAQRQVKNLEAKESRRSGATTPTTTAASEPVSADSAKEDKKKKEKKSKTPSSKK